MPRQITQERPGQEGPQAAAREVEDVPEAGGEAVSYAGEDDDMGGTKPSDPDDGRGEEFHGLR
jgi:hypothetical protein